MQLKQAWSSGLAPHQIRLHKIVPTALRLGWLGGVMRRHVKALRRVLKRKTSDCHCLGVNLIKGHGHTGTFQRLKHDLLLRPCCVDIDRSSAYTMDSTMPRLRGYRSVRWHRHTNSLLVSLYIANARQSNNLLMPPSKQIPKLIGKHT